MRGLLPNGGSPKKILVDIAHTYAICGFGKDDLASGLVFLAHHCGVWGAGNWELQLERAFLDFEHFCRQKGRTTSITAFNKEELKMKSPLCLQPEWTLWTAEVADISTGPRERL